MKPRLIQPVDVTVRRVDPGATEWDPDFREAKAGTKIAYKEPETFKAQVSFTRYEERQVSPGGDSPATAGYLLYEREKVPSLKKGDQIEAVGGQALTNVFVHAVEPTTPYGGQYHFEQAQFQERAKGL